METNNTHNDRVAAEWLTSLQLCVEHLQSVESVTRQLHTSVNDLQYQQHLQQLKNNIVVQRNIIKQLNDEVLKFEELNYMNNNAQPFDLAFMIAKNRIREKIRKAEQNVFLLKYQANKLLSIAS